MRINSQSKLQRRVGAVAALAAAFALVAPMGASAAPEEEQSTGSASNGGSLSAGSATEAVDLGSAVIPEGIFDVIIDQAMTNGIPTDVDGLINFGLSALNATGSLAPTQPCNASTQSGGDGITTTNHELGGSGPMTFNLRYETYTLQDKIEVLYHGKIIADTGWVGDAINQGTGVLTVNVPAGASSVVQVRVNGGGSTTKWDYTVNCPS